MRENIALIAAIVGLCGMAFLLLIRFLLNRQ